MPWKLVGKLHSLESISWDYPNGQYEYGICDPNNGCIIPVAVCWQNNPNGQGPSFGELTTDSGAEIWQSRSGSWFRGEGLFGRQNMDHFCVYVSRVPDLDQEQRNEIQALKRQKAEQQRKIELLIQEKAELQRTIQQSQQQGQVIEQLEKEKMQLSQSISNLNRQNSEHQHTAELLIQEKANQQHIITTLNQDKADLKQQTQQQGQVIERLEKEKMELSQSISNFNQQNPEHQRNVELLIQEKAHQQHIVAALNQEKADLKQQNEQQGRVIENLNVTIQTIGRIIHVQEQEIKGLKGELDNARRFHDQASASSSRADQSWCEVRWQRITESGFSLPSSGPESSWLHCSSPAAERNGEDAASLVSVTPSTHFQVRSSGATDRNSDDAASLVSVDTPGPHCWMNNALFRKVTESGEFYVEAHTLVEGSLVRASSGNIVKVACPPMQYDTDVIIQLHAAGAKLPLTPSHRVPIVGGGEKAARDLRRGDVIFVSGKPAELTSTEEITGKWDVVRIRFVPDEPVPAFMAPPSIDTKGYKKKPLRRSLRHRRLNKEASGLAELRTEGYYTD